MKVIIKIEQYFPDTEQITFKICGLHSHKTINDYRDYAIEISDLDMTDTESFIDSLVFKVKHLLQEQDENEPILDENIPVNVDEELDFNSIVGKVIEGRAFDRSTRMLKMRRILL